MSAYRTQEEAIDHLTRLTATLWATIQRLEQQARGNQRNFAVLPDLKTRHTHAMLRLCNLLNIKTED